MGLPYSLNKAIKYSSGKFIFRADDDDFSHKDNKNSIKSFKK